MNPQPLTRDILKIEAREFAIHLSQRQIPQLYGYHRWEGSRNLRGTRFPGLFVNTIPNGFRKFRTRD